MPLNPLGHSRGPQALVFRRDTPANFTVTDAMNSEANAGVAYTMEVSGGRRSLIPMLARCTLDVSGILTASVRWRFTRTDGTTFLSNTHANATPGADETFEFSHGTSPTAAGTSSAWDEEFATDGVGGKAVKKMELLAWKSAIGAVSITSVRLAWIEM